MLNKSLQEIKRVTDEKTPFHYVSVGKTLDSTQLLLHNHWNILHAEIAKYFHQPVLNSKTLPVTDVG